MPPYQQCYDTARQVNKRGKCCDSEPVELEHDGTMMAAPVAVVAGVVGVEVVAAALVLVMVLVRVLVLVLVLVLAGVGWWVLVPVPVLVLVLVLVLVRW